MTASDGKSDARFSWPPPELWPADAPIAIGGSLDPQRLVDAYRRGIFPWPVDEGARGLWWWSPDPRGVLDPTRFHVPRRLARTLRSGRFRFSVDTAFERVIRACATHGSRPGNTWITSQMMRAYVRLHGLGICHSVEVWEGERLAGGIYGVSFGGFFAGESMFARVRDASKAGLVWLVEGLRDRGCTLFDVQVASTHLEQFGVESVPRARFLERLSESLELDPCWPPSGGGRAG